MGAPIIESPNQLNMDIDKIHKMIKLKQQQVHPTNQETLYIFVHGGKKDYHITQNISANAIKNKYNNYFNDRNFLFVDTDKDMKHVYSSLNHASLIFSKHFMDTFSVLIAKLAADTKSTRDSRLTRAKRQLLLQDKEPIDLIFLNKRSIDNRCQDEKELTIDK